MLVAAGSAACKASRFRRSRRYVKGLPLDQTVCSFFYVSCSANIPPGAERTADYCFTLRATTIYSCPATVRGCGGIIPPRGARGCYILAKGYGAKPHCCSRAFSDMRGESAPAMTKCGEHEECSRRFIAGVCRDERLAAKYYAPSSNILSATRAMNSPLVGFSLAE